jgi:catechol 2,3-dioxygenase-like lactoylglutathione lyase family enzyme
VAKVTGIGGVFIRSKDPAALAAWYREALGLEFEGAEPAAVLPDTGSSYSVFALFAPDSTYIGDPATQGAMANLRVDDLDGVLARLDELGVAHEPASDSEYGRFSWLSDPEGRRLELWEPGD